MELKELIGQQIFVLSPRVSHKPEEVQSVILHGVEPAGIWIEVPEIQESVLKRLQSTMHESTPIIFLPYHQIDLIVSEIPKTLLSEKIPPNSTTGSQLLGWKK